MQPGNEQVDSNNSEALGHGGGREVCAPSIAEGWNVDREKRSNQDQLGENMYLEVHQE